MNKGKGYAKGIEFFLQKKLSSNWHGTISYSFSESKGLDPRFNKYFPWDYDYRHVFTFILGYKAKLMHTDWYPKFKKTIWDKLFGWILPFGDEVVTSLRVRYLGGRPYTKPIYHPEYKKWLVDENLLYNQNRFPHYLRIDLRIDRRFFFNKFNIITYFDIMNVLGRDNIWDYSYKNDGTTEKILQFQTFPVGGFVLEF